MISVQGTSITVQGLAVAEYDLVNFSIKAFAEEDTGPKAKDSLRKFVDSIQTALQYLREKEDVTIDPDRLKTSVSVNAIQQYNTKKQKWVSGGYRANYHLSFQSSNADKASTIHDVLSSLTDVEVSSPQFKIKDLDALHKIGLKDAFNRMNMQFSNECEVLGKKAENYEIENWNVHYNESQSGGRRVAGASMMRINEVGSAAGAPPPPIEIQSGKAEITVTLTVSLVTKR